MRKLFSILFLTVILTSCSKQKNKLSIIFDRVNGLKLGSTVQKKGVAIGEVSKIDLLGNEVIVDIELKDKIQIPVGSQFYISNTLIGDATINVDFSINSNYLASKDTAKGTFGHKTLLDDIFLDSAKRKEFEKELLKKLPSNIEELSKAITITIDSTSKK